MTIFRRIVLLKKRREPHLTSRAGFARAYGFDSSVGCRHPRKYESRELHVQQRQTRETMSDYRVCDYRRARGPEIERSPHDSIRCRRGRIVLGAKQFSDRH